MNGHKTNEKRQDRLLAFFDAVLAIAMTVLALEIVVPQLSASSQGERYSFFVSLTCYLISFVAMGTLWFVHNNFFSSHDLTGRNSEIVLHLVLLFFITLFQPLTKAIGQYHFDPIVRAMYLADFFVMYGVTALIMVMIRRRENQFNRKRSQRMSAAKEKRRNFPKAESEMTPEEKELRKMVQLVYAIENPEELQKKLAEFMPDEYQQEWAELKKQREASYRMSMYSVFAMAAAVLAAVVLLIFSVWWSYLALAAGIAAIVVIRHHN